MTHESTKGQHCCPPFDPTLWDGKTHVWKDRLFIKDSVPQLFHMPFPPMVGAKIGKMWKMAQDAKADPKLEDFIVMAYDPSPWKSEFYMTVTKEVPGIENVKLSGTFLTKVFDGPFNAVPKWAKEMDEYVAKKGKTVKKYYFYFTTCPKCAKISGHNYAVAFAEVE